MIDSTPAKKAAPKKAVKAKKPVQEVKKNPCDNCKVTYGTRLCETCVEFKGAK